MAKSLEIPHIDLAGDVSIPQFGLGVFQVPPEKTFENVTHALNVGYRHIDTARAYQQRGAGRAGRERPRASAARSCSSPRSCGTRTRPSPIDTLKQSLELLETEYVDLYLIHWPAPGHDHYVQAWEGLVEAQKQGLARAIGVSNFQAEHLREIIDATGVTPAVNQIELHPYLTQHGLRREHADRGIVTEAWSPLAQGAVLDDPVITEIAARAQPHRGPDRPALARRARQRRVPEVDDARRGSRRTSTSSTSSSPPRRWSGSRPWTGACAPARTPTRSTAERGQPEQLERLRVGRAGRGAVDHDPEVGAVHLEDVAVQGEPAGLRVVDRLRRRGVDRDRALLPQRLEARALAPQLVDDGVQRARRRGGG